MTRTTHRPRGPLVALALALALLSVACQRTTTSVGAAAATVDGERITAADLDRDLTDVASNGPYLEARSQQGLSFRGAEPGTFDATVVAEVLDRKVTSLLARRELARRGLSASPTEVDAARQELRRQVVDPASGTPLMDGFPRRYVDEQALTQAESDVLEASEGKVALDEASLRAAYEANTDQFRQWCVRWIVAGPDKPEAVIRAAAAVAGGEDFIPVAQRESADTDSAGRGGALGCQTREGLARLGDQFRQVVTGLAPGQVSPPTAAEYGTFIVQLTEVKLTPFEEVRDVVRGRALAAAEEPYTQLLARLRHEANVTVAPRFGTWDRTKPDEPRIAPPGGRTPTTAAGAPTTLGLTKLPGGLAPGAP
ncbi:MAG: peptidyl-prolyl cis-trans isomerase [Acidimicrobiales bacterium]